MKAKKLYSKDNELVLELSDITFGQANTLRRLMMNEVPIMAIEKVEFKQNSSIMYDEMLAHRMGLTPLVTDAKNYNLPEECTCEGAGCAKCQAEFTLTAKGPCTVYAKDLKCKDPKIKPVYPDLPLVKLLENQEVELSATAQLGFGKEHTKWASGLVSYKQKPTLKIGKADTKTVSQAVKKLGLDAVSEKSGKLVVDETKLALSASPEAYEDLDREIQIEFSKDTFIFTVESWGQLSPQDIMALAIERMNKYCKEFEKLVKAI